MVRTAVGALLVLAALTLAAGAGIQYPPPHVAWVQPGGDALSDTTCSHASWRDTVYLSGVPAPAGTLHVAAIAFDWTASWTVECPPDDNDAGVYVWWLPIWNSVEQGSMLVRQNTSWTSYIPAKAWYFRGANAAADSCVRYQFSFEGKPTGN